MYTHIKKITKKTEYFKISFDINEDNLPDHFISVNCNELKPCLFYVFISKGKHFVERGTILLQYKKFEILKRTHNGVNDIFYYHEKDETLGTIVRYEFNGSKYDVKTSYTSKYQIGSLLDTRNWFNGYTFLHGCKYLLIYTKV